MADRFAYASAALVCAIACVVSHALFEAYRRAWR